MKAIGLIRELEKGAKARLPSINELRDRMSDEEATAVLAHLERGVDVVDVMEATQDPLDPTRFLPGGATLVTDGQWVWRKDLAYFVERYRICLAGDFVDEVMSGAGKFEAEETVLRRWDEARTAFEKARNEQKLH